MKKNLQKWFGVVSQHKKTYLYGLHAILLMACLVLFTVKTYAQDDLSSERDRLMQAPEEAPKLTKENTPPIVELGTEFQNNIQFLNNRFRVDNDVDEVTMVFFRENGSAPIVLVRPDGSKVFIENDTQDPNLRWYETQTYDMISIKNPMPGPWQAVGQILEGSKVMVIADIVLDAQPIPANIYSGEIIKHTAVLKNAGKQVDFSPFRDVVSLSIDFVSNNNPNYENFGLGSRTIARFKDNGEGLDEVAADGVFTGQFNLSIPSGEWRPTFSIRTPMYNREQINETVLLHPNPILINVKIAEADEAEHIITVDTDSEHIKLGTLLLNGKVKRPNGEVDNITLTETNESIKVIKVKNDSFGIYRIKLTAFATTVDGREVIIDVPEHTFVTSEPEPEIDLVKEADITETEAPLVIPEPEETWTTQDTVSAIIAINLFILLFGGTGLYLILNARKYPDDHIALRCKLSCLGLIGKLKNIKKKKTKEEDEE